MFPSSLPGGVQVSSFRPFYWAKRNAWYVHVKIDGKRSKRKIGDTKREAFDAWKAMVKDSAESKVNPTFESIAIDWLRVQAGRLSRDEVSPEWFVRVGRTIESFTKGNQVRCLEMDASFWDNWIGSRSSNYARTELATMRQVLRWAVASKKIPHNPMDGYTLPSMQSRSRILSFEEHCQLCRASDRKFKPILRIAWMVGCRPGELRNLKWSQLESGFTRAVIGKHKTAKKTGKPRIIYFPPRAQKLLQKLQRDRGKLIEKSKKRNPVPESSKPFVFLNHRKKPWTKNAIVLRMQRLRKDTGLDLVAYNYRHTWITRALKSNVPIATVAELSGHTDIDMIARVYGHLCQHPDHLSNAAASVK
jgi:integrase